MAKKIKQPIDRWVAITGLLCLVGIQMAAWYMGKNGLVTGTVMFLIGGILGLNLPQVKFIK